MRQEKYAAAKFVMVRLGPRLGGGASGDVYQATFPGRKGTFQVVVKMAFNLERLCRLHHEYLVYSHLREKGVVDAIPYIYGFYQDGECGVGALVMTDVGTPLGMRRSKDKTLRLTAAEKQVKFLATFTLLTSLSG